MSVFRYGRCDSYIDGDYNGCNEHPFDEMACLCDDCEAVYGCFECGLVSKDNICVVDKSPIPLFEKYICRGCA